VSVASSAKNGEAVEIDLVACDGIQCGMEAAQAAARRHGCRPPHWAVALHATGGSPRRGRMPARLWACGTDATEAMHRHCGATWPEAAEAAERWYSTSTDVAAGTMPAARSMDAAVPYTEVRRQSLRPELSLGPTLGQAGRRRKQASLSGNAAERRSEVSWHRGRVGPDADSRPARAGGRSTYARQACSRRARALRCSAVVLESASIGESSAFSCDVKRRVCQLQSCGLELRNVAVLA